MIYSLSIREDQFTELCTLLKNKEDHERAAYLLCSKSRTRSEIRFIVTRIIKISNREIQSSTKSSLTIKSKSYVKAFSEADNLNQSLIFVHSHPVGAKEFSKFDDEVEKELFRFGEVRAPNQLHGSLVIEDVSKPFLFGRVWLDQEKFVKMDTIRIVGRHIKFYFRENGLKIPTWAERQVRAFGKYNQVLLRNVCIGVVGVGGTGSAVAEELIRMGVGKLVVVDSDVIENTNVTRLYGSRISDVGKSKVAIVARQAKHIGLGTVVKTIFGSVCEEKTAKILRECDLIFSCTDDASGRSIMDRLSRYYYIPVIDMAVSIDSRDGIIQDITGRVTLLMPGSSCLFCRGRITPERIHSETISRINPSEYKKRVKENYAMELPERDPSVIMLTTNIASMSVLEFINMLTGFMGKEWRSTEFVERYHETDPSIRVSKNLCKSLDGCWCGESSKWGKADTANFLGMFW